MYDTLFGIESSNKIKILPCHAISHKGNRKWHKGAGHYGEIMRAGDIARIELNSAKKTMELLVNDISQGIAFSSMEHEDSEYFLLFHCVQMNMNSLILFN